MAIACPYCATSIQLKEPKPGRYQPKCPKCGEKFKLAVYEDPSRAPEAARLVESGAGIDETRTPISDAAAHETAAVAAKPAAIIPQDHRSSERQTSGDAPTIVPSVTSPATAETLPPAPASGGAGEATAPQLSRSGVLIHERAPATSSLSSAPAGSDATTGFDVAAEVGVSRLDDVPATLGGYQMLKELGRGGMGAVYLARQISLDRNVAVKVMRPEWAKDPIFVARFTREAYSAAQLNHHNVVQIHDIGAQHDTNYFSMEFVEGQSLADVLRRDGKLDAEVAVGYVLQAARGLAFAHEQGMVHRDIKPDNLLLSRHGIVKVADLGIVKTSAGADKAGPTAGPGVMPRVDPSAPTQVTLAGVAMGTPAYMAPEQARDAARVDARADIYSLGCTLYALVTGRAPFAGKTAAEVMTKHATEPVLPPELVVKRVPKALSEVILKMVAKAPEDRYQSMTEVAKALEQFLGVESSGPFTPREEHAETLERAVERFNASPVARLRWRGLAGGAGALAIIALGLLFVSPPWAGAAAGLGVLTAVAYFVLGGVTQKTHLFAKVRQLAFGASWSDWAMAIIAGLLLLAGLHLVGWLWIWLGAAVVAVLLAAALCFGLDRKLAADRREPLEVVEQMLKSMRLHGLEEDALRQFVCKYSGRRWEPFYEALFGYDAKISARERWGQGERGLGRPRYRGWRDPIVRWIDARLEARRQTRERRHLQSVEEKSLKASGLDAAQARQKAEQAAAALVSKAARTRKVPVEPALARQGAGPAALLSGLFGRKARFAAGALLVAGCLAWMHQNEMLAGKKLKQMASEAIENQDFQRLADVDKLKSMADVDKLKSLADIDKLKSNLQGLKDDANLADLKAAVVKKRKPLSLPLTPEWVSRPLGAFGAGAAGLLLIASAIMAGRKATAAALIALAVFAAQLTFPP